jgi:hypothetical protein
MLTKEYIINDKDVEKYLRLAEFIVNIVKKGVQDGILKKEEYMNFYKK